MVSSARLPSVEFFDPLTREWSEEAPSDEAGLGLLGGGTAEAAASRHKQQPEQPAAPQVAPQPAQETLLTQRALAHDSCHGDTSAVTYVQSSSARSCNSLRLLDQVLKSHFDHMHGFADMKKVLVFDGFGDVTGRKRSKEKLDRATYDHHKTMVKTFLDNSPLYKDVAVVALPRWGSLLRSVHIALEKVVRTPYVYIAQDDIAVRPVNVSARKIIASMDKDDGIKYVRMSWKARGGIGLSERTDEKHCADLYQDNFFSDRNHFSRRQWYLDHVIKPIDPNYASDLENGTLHIRTPWMEQNRDRLLKNGTTGGYMFSLGTDHVPKAGALNTRTLVDLNGRDPHWCKVK